jgi:hypothetical protein
MSCAGPFHEHLAAKHLCKRKQHCFSWETMLDPSGLVSGQPSERYLHAARTFTEIASKAIFLAMMMGAPHSRQICRGVSEQLKHKQ